uniref:Bile acid-CoA:amino acid N-acyltransferase-like n=1 Tax=Phallusia mammillata TaxID=59560 RepID=A0A6F9D7X4_9ASCI|nr:bile acid-CoA:amino acid N-acyltransferase-like [Phallusia mammillata]
MFCKSAKCIFRFRIQKLPLQRKEVAAIVRSLHKASPSVTVSPEQHLIDETINISFQGLPPSEDVSLYASLSVSNNTIYESSANYRTSLSGTLDLTKDCSIGGTYCGIEPMGLFWSMKPYSLVKKRPLRYPNTSVETPIYNLALHKGKVDILDLRKKTSDGSEILKFDIPRPILGPGIRRIPVRSNGLAGTLFLPAGNGPHPGVIAMFGGYPGIREYKGALLASHGFATLVLGYFGFEHLPKHLLDTLDLEYFEKALNFMQQHNKVQNENGIGLLGICKGGTIAMAMASLMSGVGCVVCINASVHTVVGDCKYKGKTYPGFEIKPTKLDENGRLNLARSLNLPAPEKLHYLPGYFNFEEQHTIPFLIIAGMDDQCVPSSYQAMVAEMSLLESKHPDYEIVRYPGTGHILEPPNFPFCFEMYQGDFGVALDMGGCLPMHSHAEKDAWKRQLEFLSDKLK